MVPLNFSLGPGLCALWPWSGFDGAGTRAAEIPQSTATLHRAGGSAGLPGRCLTAWGQWAVEPGRFFVKDRPKGPPTANRQLPPTANRHQPRTSNRHQPPPTASGDQLPTNHYQPPPTTNYQPPTAANHHQPPPTASCQLPTANRRQPPPTMVEHMQCPRAFLGPLCNGTLFFLTVKDRPGWNFLLYTALHCPLPQAGEAVHKRSSTALHCPLPQAIEAV